MKLSVIIPAHNEEKYIGSALKALLTQDYPDFEVIVVDNASTDKTAEIARTFPVTVVSESRKGTMWACERGRREARGEIIVRMDADCLPEMGWLSRGAALFTDDSVVGVTGPYRYIDQTGIFTSVLLRLQMNVVWLGAVATQFFKHGGLLVGGNSFMRASALEKIGGFNTAITFYGDDTDTAKRLANVGKLVFSRKLALPSSARRFTKEGVVKTLIKYLRAFLGIIFKSSS